MKRTKQSRPWYNTRSKELGAILLERREAIARYGEPCPGPRMGPWLADTYPGFGNVIR